MLNKEILGKRIGDGIKQLRIYHRLSVKEVAEKLNVPYQTYKRWEDGDVLPSLYNFFKICEFFDVSPEEILFYGEKGVTENYSSLKKLEKFLINKPKTLKLLNNIIEKSNDKKNLLSFLSQLLGVLEEFYSEIDE